MKLKAKLKELTGRSNGMGNKQRKETLNLFICGWVEYYKLARMKKTLETIDQWLRRRIRMCIWKSWKNPRTRIANLIKCGVPKWRACKLGWIKGYLASRWVRCNKPCNEQQEPVSCRLSLSDGLLCIGIVNEEPLYAEPHVRWCERSENEVRGKLLHFPPTRFRTVHTPCSSWSRWPSRMP